MRWWLIVPVAVLLAGCGSGGSPSAAALGGPAGSGSAGSGPAGSAGGGGASAPAGTGAAVCGLLQSAEIQAATGVAVTGFAKTALSADRECTWQLALPAGVTGTTPHVDASFFGGQTQYDAISKQGKPISGLGDQAYQEAGQGIVGVIRHGRFFVLGVTLHAPGQGTPALAATEDAAALALATAITGRI
jgi:hypothetical protein